MSLLQKGDTVGFVATSSGLNGKKIDFAIKYFETELNLKVKTAANLNMSYRYMAGSDAERVKKKKKMYQDKEVKAIFAIRGGAGSLRMIEQFNFDIAKNNPKPLLGLSDVTTIQNALLAKTDIPNYTGFLPLYHLHENFDIQIGKNLKDVLFATKHKIVSGKPMVGGQANGEIIGGCLSSFLYLAGTDYMPDFANKILLLEDIGEKTYKIDLMLRQLQMQKNFDKLQGIILGQFTNCFMADNFDGDIGACINDFVKDINIPIICDFNYGHIPNSYILPLGIKVKMNVADDGCSITYE